MHNWKQLTSDEEILQTVLGYTIEFETIANPCQDTNVRKFVFNEAETQIIANEIANLEQKEVIEKAEHEPREFISNSFLRKKKEWQIQGDFEPRRIQPACRVPPF